MQACCGMDHMSMLTQLAPPDRHTARMLMRNFLSKPTGADPHASPLEGRLGEPDCQVLVKSVLAAE